MLEERIYKFLQEAGPIFFVTPGAGRALGLEKELPDYHIVCARDGGDAGLIRENGVKVFCLEKDIKNSSRLLADDSVIKYIKENSTGRTANIMTFKPSPMIEKICEKNGFRYLGNRSEINRTWEDKIKFAEIAASLGIPNADSKVIRMEKGMAADFLDFSAEKKYVIQFPHGYSGNSTLLAEKQEDMESIIKNNPGRKAKVARYKEGDSYTFDACVGEFGTLASGPIFQITGFAQFNRNILGTCGNDYAFGRGLAESVREKIDACIGRVADRLFGEGYRGIMGFDFVVGKDEIDLIEVNPRFVGSIPAFTGLQLEEGETPFLLLHILSFLNFDFSGIKIKKPQKEGFDFSQVILRNTGSAPAQIKKALEGGIYKMAPSGIILQKKAYRTATKMAPDEFFLQCAASGESIDPDMEYANIQLGCGIMKTREEFKEDFLGIKNVVLRSITLK